MSGPLILDDAQHALLEALAQHPEGLHGLTVSQALGEVSPLLGLGAERLEAAMGELVRLGLAEQADGVVRLTRTGFVCAVHDLCRMPPAD